MKALTKQQPHHLDLATKKDMMEMVYTAIFTKMGNRAALSALKQALKMMPEHEVAEEWKAIEDGTVSTILETFLSGKLDQSDLANINQLFEGLAKPYFQDYKGNVPKADLQWAHKEIKDFFTNLHTLKIGKEDTKSLPASQKLLGNFKKTVKSYYDIVEG